MTNISSIAQNPAGRNPSRTGLGYGQNQNVYHKPRPVSSGDYGIYNPKGNWDKEIDQDKLKKKKSRKKRKKTKQDYRFDVKVNRVLGSSQFVSATDSMPHYDKFSFVGAAGAGHTTLRAHDETEGHALLEQFIQESISGNHYIRRSGKGNLYPKHNVTNPKSGGQAPSYAVASQYRNHKRTGNRFAVSGYTVNKPEEYYLLDDECNGEETTGNKIRPDTYDSDQKHIDDIELHIQKILNLT